MNMKSSALLVLLLLLLGVSSCFRQKPETVQAQHHPHEHLQASALEPLAKLHTVDYTVRAGETLETVATQRYGHPHYYGVIKLYNHLDDEAQVSANQILRLPDMSAILAEEGLARVIPHEVNLILCSRAKYDNVLGQLRAHQLTDDVKQQLLEAADDLQQVTESLRTIKPGMTGMPLRMIGQLEQCRDGMRVFTDTGRFDSYGYDIDMVRQRYALALTYAIIWARDGYK